MVRFHTPIRFMPSSSRLSISLFVTAPFCHVSICCVCSPLSNEEQYNCGTASFVASLIVSTDGDFGSLISLYETYTTEAKGSPPSKNPYASKPYYNFNAAAINASLGLFNATALFCGSTECAFLNFLFISYSTPVVTNYGLTIANGSCRDTFNTVEW